MRDLRTNTLDNGVHDRTELEERRQRLQARIDTFHRNGEAYFNIPFEQIKLSSPAVTGRASDNDEDSEEDEDWRPELEQLCLPSETRESQLRNLGLLGFRDQELELRRGQANDALEALRLALGHKALLLRTEVRHAKSQATQTRAWSVTKAADRQVQTHAGIYRMCRRAMVSLGADQNMLGTYKELSDQDIKVNADITEENRVYQRSHTLPWIWLLPGQRDGEDSAWMEECEWI